MHKVRIVKANVVLGIIFAKGTYLDAGYWLDTVLIDRCICIVLHCFVLKGFVRNHV